MDSVLTVISISSIARAAPLLVLLAASVQPGSLRVALAQSASSAKAAHAPARRTTVVGISNFAVVTPRLYRGGQPTRAGFENLKHMGIDIVVDVRLSGRDHEREVVTKAGMQFVGLPWHCLYPRDEIFARFLALLRENPKKKVFVHCRYGDDRTGMMIAAYRMAVEGWTYQEARQEMNKFGFHHYVCAALVRYEKRFPERLKTSAAFEEWRNQSVGPR